MKVYSKSLASAWHSVPEGSLKDVANRAVFDCRLMVPMWNRIAYRAPFVRGGKTAWIAYLVASNNSRTWTTYYDGYAEREFAGIARVQHAYEVLACLIAQHVEDHELPLVGTVTAWRRPGEYSTCTR